MQCDCGGQNHLVIDKLPKHISKMLFGIDDILISRHNYCRDCGKGTKAIYHGTKCIKISNEDMIFEDDD